MKALRLTLAGLLLISTAALAQEQPPARVVVGEVKIENVSENSSFQGLLYYDRTSQVSSDVSGLVVKAKVNEGDKVKTGETLVVLDTELLEQEIAMQRTLIEQLELRIGNTEKNFKRLEKLYAQEGISEKAFDDAQYSYQDALKDKQVAQHALEALLIKSRKSIIKAPFDGVVLEKSVDTGDWVQQGKQLIKLGASDELFVRVPIAEKLLRHLKVGGKVSVVVTAFDKKVTGKVVDIDPIADAKTKNVFMKVRIPKLDNVAENMSAYVHVNTSAKRKLAMIPRDALIKFQGKDFVYTVKDDKASILPVNIVSYQGGLVGADNPYFVAGMPIIIEGNERVRPDQPVAIVPAMGK